MVKPPDDLERELEEARRERGQEDVGRPQALERRPHGAEDRVGELLRHVMAAFPLGCPPRGRGRGRGGEEGLVHARGDLGEAEVEVDGEVPARRKVPRAGVRPQPGCCVVLCCVVCWWGGGVNRVRLGFRLRGQAASTTPHTHRRRTATSCAGPARPASWDRKRIETE